MKPGDILQVTSRGIPLLKHAGIVSMDSETAYVWHNTPGMVNSLGGGVIREPLFTFMKGREVLSITSTGIDSSEIEARAWKLRDRPFNLFSFNCEHFINGVVYERFSSPQLFQSFLLLILVLGSRHTRI